MNLRTFRRAGHSADAPLCLPLLYGQLHGLDDGRGPGQLNRPRPRGTLRLAEGPDGRGPGARRGAAPAGLRPAVPTTSAPKQTALIGLALTLVPLLMGWLWSDTYLKVLLVGLLLGVAGASFAAALPLASRWYPPEYQGLVLGIAGAGNVGTALPTLLRPLGGVVLGLACGVFGVALVPVLVTLALFVAPGRGQSDAPPPPKTLADYAAVLKVATPDGSASSMPSRSAASWGF